MTDTKQHGEDLYIGNAHSEEFDDMADVWSEHKDVIAYSSLFAKTVKKHITLPENGSIMDFGGGTGNLLFSLAKEFPNAACLFNVDFSQKMIDVSSANAKKLGLSSKFEGFPVLLEKPGQIDIKVDIIVTSFVIHHLPRPVDTMTVLKTYLKPGGTIFVFDFHDGPDSDLCMTFHPDDPMNHVTRRMKGECKHGKGEGDHHGHEHGHKWYTNDDAVKVLNAADFSNVEAFDVLMKRGCYRPETPTVPESVEFRFVAVKAKL
eukprot:TRINITY_DN1692_c0_g1_i1.p1 TRINITY_DN1692_c0_g1~~TRINITY_DN1692_c0_g1_i1.p1  ORF type:complete len:301 (+),score=62.19 TRINITY_DN1692_c0_g1_i1:122-904(+)